MKHIVPSTYSKLNPPTNLVKRSSNHTKLDVIDNLMGSNEQSPHFETELSTLKKQIEVLQKTVNSMRNDTDYKDNTLQNIAKEKEQLANDLKKQRRSNTSLKQQLEDERCFYYKEKEEYCKQMNRFKKLRGGKRGDSEIDGYKKEIEYLKNALNQTLEANYNLSVKFLRMKNTKLCLKNRLNKLEDIHERTVKEFKKQLEDVRSDLNEVVNEKFHKSISPSSKKYLQLIKQNGSLIHENVCLQLDVNRLNLELDKMKMIQVKNDTKNKLKFIKSVDKTSDTLKRNKVKEVKEKIKPKNSSLFEEKTASVKSKIEIPPIILPIDEPSEDGKNYPRFTFSDSKYDLMTVSNSNISEDNDESSYYTTLKGVYRTQSAPGIVQTSENG